MISFIPSTENDIGQIQRWADLDPWHDGQHNPEWWLTASPGSLLCFRLGDQIGPLCYVRLDAKSDGLIRLHTQFAPIEEVSKLRLVKGMLFCVPVVQEFCRQQHGAGIVFQSASPTLIYFMKRVFEFEELHQDDFVWYAV